MSSNKLSVRTDSFPLPSGDRLPAIGYGALEKGLAFGPEERPRILEMLIHVIRAGYRLIDTAKIYGTEEIVGEAVRSCGVPRSEICVVTKLWNADHGRVKEAFNESFAKLGLDYIDIFLMHWPCASEGTRQLPIEASPTYLESWTAMEALVGPKCRNIGVSNFSQKTLDALLAHAKIKPAVNQIEISPLNPALKLVPYCLERGIRVMAWGPLTGGPKSAYGKEAAAVWDLPVLKQIAEKYNSQIGVILLSWCYTRGIVAIPHTTSRERIDAYLRLIKLTDEEVESINDIRKTLGERRLIDGIDFVWSDDAIPGKGRTILGWTVQEMGWEDEKGNNLL